MQRAVLGAGTVGHHVRRGWRWPLHARGLGTPAAAVADGHRARIEAAASTAPDMPVPCVPALANDIRLLASPTEFYESLLGAFRAARHRVVIASLYLGTDTEDHGLVEALRARLDERPSLEVEVLLDYTRATRGAVNSTTMLEPLLKFPNVRLHLFHTPDLRGMTRRVVPSPFNEVFGLTHLKAYTADDTTVLSGANLSRQYYQCRQDRYMAVTSSGLADYFQRLVRTLGGFCFECKGAGQLVASPDPARHPLHAPRHEFKAALRAEVAALCRSEAASHSTTSAGSADTWLYPMLQMGPFGVRQDEAVTTSLLQADAGTEAWMATGYFNLPSTYTTAILQSEGEYRIVTASPEANGFLGARGPMGHVPAAYTYIEGMFLREVEAAGRTATCRLFEYSRPGWTFHGKGLWLSQGGGPPHLTLIGSPNFGHRSLQRDLEAQVAVVTRDSGLAARLGEERDALFQLSTIVGLEALQAEGRRVHWAEKVATHAVRSFF